MICLYNHKYHVLSGDKKLIPVKAIIENDGSVSLIPTEGERVLYSEDLGCEVITLDDVKKRLTTKYEKQEEHKTDFAQEQRPVRKLKKFM